MELHDLKPAKGSTKSGKRIARGQGSGRGGTSTRGHKGAKSRSGYKSRRNFEGGQMPLQMRLPKRGFKNINKVTYVAINVSQIQEIVDKYNITDITNEALYNSGFIKKTDVVKVLGNGEISAKVNVNVDAISKSAISKIEGAGGSVTQE